MLTPAAARRAYRDAWGAWCMTTDPVVRKALEDIMDSLQPKIARGPDDPAWREFAETLPGFLEYWERWSRSLVGSLERLK